MRYVKLKEAEGCCEYFKLVSRISAQKNQAVNSPYDWSVLNQFQLAAKRVFKMKYLSNFKILKCRDNNTFLDIFLQ